MADADKPNGSKSKEAGNETTPRRRPSNIPRMFESGETSVVQATILSTYGFPVSEQFASDFIAFIDKAIKGDYIGD